MEGLVLFIILWVLRKKPFHDGMMVAFFIFFYGLFRFLIEFFREPDLQVGYLLGFLTMGQLLCLAMIAAALLLALCIRWKAQQAAIRP